MDNIFVKFSGAAKSMCTPLALFVQAEASQAGLGDHTQFKIN